MRAPIIAIIALLIGAGALWYLAPDGSTTAPGRKAAGPTVVIVAEVAKQPMADVIEALGTTRARESVVLTSSISEKVLEIRFADGAQVQAGELMVRLDDVAERADLAAARARLDEKRRSLVRVRRLIADKVMTEAQLDTAQSELRTAEAQVQVLEAAIDDRQIRAPFSGRAGLREISVGALIQPGERITTLHDIAVLDVDFTVPEVDMASLAAGQPVRVRSAAYPALEFGGVLHAVATQVDPVSRAVTARARLTNSDGRLRPGMLVGIEILSRERDAIMVPEAALILRADEAIVYVDDQGRADRRIIRTGARRRGYVEVLSGLQVGERIVIHGADKLGPGKELAIRGVYDGSVPIAELLKARDPGK